MRGRFVVLDGPDGSGKSTQAARLQKALQARGVQVLLLREPGGTAAGEAVRKILLEHRDDRLSALCETFLFQAARAQLVEEVIAPALARGAWVVCDRFTLSTLAYQGHAGHVGTEAVERLSRLATGGLQPDRYLVLLVPPAEGQRRRANRPADRMEAKGVAFARRMDRAYRLEARRHPARYTAVDGRGSVEDVQKRIWAQVEPLLR